MSLLVEVGLSVPFSVDLEGSEHSSLSAHVTEGSLSRSVGTRSSNSGDSSHSSSGSPGLGGVLHTSVVLDGVSLSSVLGDVGVNEMDDIVSDGGSEDSGHVLGRDNFGVVGVGVYAHDGSGGHYVFLSIK